jgi:hypothetical protein
MENEPSNEPSNFKLWLKRIGFGGFLFFLIKGLIWLALFFGLGKYIGL